MVNVFGEALVCIAEPREEQQRHHHVLFQAEQQGVSLWDFEKQQVVRQFRGHDHDVFSVAFSSDGKRMVTTSQDESVKLWDVDTQQCIQTWRGHHDAVFCACFMPQTHQQQIVQVVSGAGDSTLKLWRVDSKSCVRTFTGHEDGVFCVALTIDSNLNKVLMVSGAGDCTLRLWDVDHGDCVRVFQGHWNVVTCVTFASDGRRFVSGSNDTTVRMWDVFKGSPIGVCRGHHHGVTCVDFARGSSMVLSGSQDTKVKLWDAATCECTQTFEGHSTGVVFVQFNDYRATVTQPPSLQSACSGSLSRVCKVWNLATAQCMQVTQGFSGDTCVPRTFAASLAPQTKHHTPTTKAVALHPPNIPISHVCIDLKLDPAHLLGLQLPVFWALVEWKDASALSQGDPKQLVNIARNYADQRLELVLVCEDGVQTASSKSRSKNRCTPCKDHDRLEIQNPKEFYEKCAPFLSCLTLCLQLLASHRASKQSRSVHEHEVDFTPLPDLYQTLQQELQYVDDLSLQFQHVNALQHALSWHQVHAKLDEIRNKFLQEDFQQQMLKMLRYVDAQRPWRDAVELGGLVKRQAKTTSRFRWVCAHHAKALQYTERPSMADEFLCLDVEQVQFDLHKAEYPSRNELYHAHVMNSRVIQSKFFQRSSQVHPDASYLVKFCGKRRPQSARNPWSSSSVPEVTALQALYASSGDQATEFVVEPVAFHEQVVLNKAQVAAVLVMIHGKRNLREMRKYTIHLHHVMTPIASMLAFIHTQGFVYGDLNMENIVDFGVCGQHNKSTLRLVDFECTCRVGQTMIPGCKPEYLSPEAATALRVKDKGFRADPSFDVWCFGVLCLEFAQREDLPLVEFINLKRHEIQAAITSPAFCFDKTLERVALSVQEEAVIRKCLSRDPTHRPSFAAIVAFLTSSDNDDDLDNHTLRLDMDQVLTTRLVSSMRSLVTTTATLQQQYGCEHKHKSFPALWMLAPWDEESQQSDDDRKFFQEQIGKSSSLKFLEILLICDGAVDPFVGASAPDETVCSPCALTLRLQTKHSRKFIQQSLPVLTCMAVCWSLDHALDLLMDSTSNRPRHGVKDKLVVLLTVQRLTEFTDFVLQRLDDHDEWKPLTQQVQRLVQLVAWGIKRQVIDEPLGAICRQTIRSQLHVVRGLFAASHDNQNQILQLLQSVDSAKDWSNCLVIGGLRKCLVVNQAGHPHVGHVRWVCANHASLGSQYQPVQREHGHA